MIGNEQVRRTLQAYITRYPEEADASMALDIILNQDLCIAAADCYPAHVVVSGLVLSKAEKSLDLLLVRVNQRWRGPGGHCAAGDDSLFAAVLRTVEEQTGICEKSLSPLPALGDIPVAIMLECTPGGRRAGTLALELYLLAGDAQAGRAPSRPGCGGCSLVGDARSGARSAVAE
jgi:hypothetical protein